LEEGHLIRELVPSANITTLPPYYYEASQIRARDVEQFDGLSDILFVGGFPHTPNVDAALFIAREVMPLVWNVRPEARLLLVGYAPPPEVQELASDRIVVTGQVPELAPWFDQSRVMLAALRYGAGVKGKVVEALRCGLPVITTSVGAEGIGITPDEDAILAEGAAELAAAVIDLFNDSERCARLSAAGAALVARRFSRAAARATLERVFQAPRCGACGSVRLLAPPKEGSARESFVCQDCYALARCEALAKVLLRRFAREGETSLPELLTGRPDLRVHELGFVGGIADSLRGFPNYSESEFFPGVPLGTLGPGGVRCEDVTQLTYPDESFDIILSQDVMEHVPDAVRGFAETARVLRPGGSHFFTIPQNPHLQHSVTRAKLGPNGVEHLLPPEYHGDPVRSEGALVFTDYGRDLAEIIAKAGLELIEHDQPVLGGSGGEMLRIFEATKRAAPLPALTHDDALLMADLQDRNEVTLPPLMSPP
jgi:SAM-dependent methyltransferase